MIDRGMMMEGERERLSKPFDNFQSVNSVSLSACVGEGWFIFIHYISLK